MFNFDLLPSLWLIFARIMSFMATAPFFSGANLPVPARGFLAFAISVMMLPLVPLPEQLTGGLAIMALAVGREALIGLMAGLICGLFIHVFNIMGQVVDLHIGFMMSNYFDPLFGFHSTLVAKFMYLAATVLFFVLDGHHVLLSALARSFEVVPLNTAVFRGGGALVLIRTFADVVSLAVRICVPVIAVTLIVDISLGLLGRAAPQMNVFMVGFPFKILAGLYTLAVMIPFMGVFFQNLIRMMERDLYTLLKGFS